MIFAEMFFDFGGGSGGGLVTSATQILGLLGMVAKGAEGENKTSLALVINERGYFARWDGRIWPYIIHEKARMVGRTV